VSISVGVVVKTNSNLLV